MEVILQKDVERLGKAFDVVKVKDGFALNFLLPQKLAVISSVGKKARIATDKKNYDRKQAGLIQKAEDIKKKLEELSITITVKVGEGDKMYGSITTQVIAEKLAKEGFTINKKDIKLKDPIKSIGVYAVPVKVHQDVTAEVKLWIVKEGGDEPETAEKPEAAAPESNA